jgi:hypothetical protein
VDDFLPSPNNEQKRRRSRDNNCGIVLFLRCRGTVRPWRSYLGSASTGSSPSVTPLLLSTKTRPSSSISVSQVTDLVSDNQLTPSRTWRCYLQHPPRRLRPRDKVPRQSVGLPPAAHLSARRTGSLSVGWDLPHRLISALGE